MSAWGREGWKQPRERMFERGELKYLFLELLRDKPRHGYDLIRAIDELAGGRYTASPGAVYPILQMLEDLGQVTVVQADGRKTYTVTAEGIAFLDENAEVVAELRKRLTGAAAGPKGAAGMDWRELRQELSKLAHVFGRTHHGHGLSPEMFARIFAIVTRARIEIEAVLNEEPD